MRAAIGLLSVLFFWSPLATAQEMVAWERFFPGEVDDFWRFDERFIVCFGYEDPICETTTSRQRSYRVTGRIQTDTSITMTFQSGQSMCRVSIAEGDAWFTVEQVEGDRCLPLWFPSSTLDFAVDEQAELAVVSVNGYDYPVAALKGEYGHTFAADLGLYSYYSQAGGGEQQFYSYYELIEAHVEGIDYGVPVSAEPDAPPAPDIALYPNPFSDQLTLRADARAARPVAVEVVDVTGRWVLETEVPASGTFALDLTTLAPGVYVVRVVAPDGTVAVRRVTKVR